VNRFGHDTEFDASAGSLTVVADLETLRLLLQSRGGIAFSVQRIKAVVAVVLALVWLPAVSCCLIDASGVLGKQECCSKAHSLPASGPGNCDQPCGVLASATYLPEQEPLVVVAPVGAALLDVVFSMVELHQPAVIGRELPGTASPELAGQWQFFFRTALPPRAPSFVS
jgi:hypothetical protein